MGFWAGLFLLYCLILVVFFTGKIMVLIEDLEEITAPVAQKEVDYSGSLDYIDNLNTRPPLTITSPMTRGRDADVVSNALLSNIASSSDNNALPRDSILLTDNRRWNPTTDFDPGELVPGASKIQADWIPYTDPDKKGRKYRVNTETGEIIYLPTIHSKEAVYNAASRRFRSDYRLKFDNPYRLTICIKRSIRREVMHALGFSGYFHRPKHWNPYSWIKC